MLTVPHASVIVPARNAQGTLPRTLTALADQELDVDYEVIVVDDGSTDRTADAARSAPGPVRVLTQSPQGAAAARNLGAAYSSAIMLAFCDADVYPTRGWLRAGVQALATADLVQGMVLPDPPAAIGPFDRTLWIMSGVGLWEAANLFVTRDLFERIGGFTDRIKPRSGRPLGEDVLFGQRARELDARLRFCPEALAHHAVFERDWRAYAAERWRRRYFPAIVRAAPGLRASFFYRRWFLDARSARFDLAVAGGIAALASGSLAPLFAAAPYLRALGAEAQRGRTAGPSRLTVAMADLAADFVSLAALLHGSVRHRAAVL
jgi:glycosyltransferase involved in cell wall biosynthesis